MHNTKAMERNAPQTILIIVARGVRPHAIIVIHHLTSIQHSACEEKLEILAGGTWVREGYGECSLVIGPDDWAMWMISDADVHVQRIPAGVARASAQCAYGIKALDYYVFYPE